MCVSMCINVYIINEFRTRYVLQFTQIPFSDISIKHFNGQLNSIRKTQCFRENVFFSVLHCAPIFHPKMLSQTTIEPLARLGLQGLIFLLSEGNGGLQDMLLTLPELHTQFWDACDLLLLQ